MKYSHALFTISYVALAGVTVLLGGAYADAVYSRVTRVPGATMDLRFSAPLAVDARGASTSTHASDLGDACEQVADHTYDCTATTTKLKVYEWAKRTGIKWFNAYDRLTSVKDKILYIADEKGFTNKPYLLALADCESKFRPEATNSRGNTPAGSTDRGLFMFNDYWQKKVSDACAHDVRCSTEKTIELLQKGKGHLWSCDGIIKRDGRIGKYERELVQK